MWVIEKYGVDAFRKKLLDEPALAGVRVEREQPAPTTPYTRRELVGFRVRVTSSTLGVG